ncbi:MAG TPA: PAS domain-containing protein, partial [Stellaceae bacterium]
MKSQSAGRIGSLEHVGAEVDPAHLDHPTLAFLRAYWESKRRGRHMPSRADIDPIEMKAHLGWIVLADVLPRLADFRLRLVGTLVTQYFLSDST